MNTIVKRKLARLYKYIAKKIEMFIYILKVLTLGKMQENLR